MTLPRVLNRQETAICLVSVLANRGAVWHVFDEDGHFHLDLDSSDVRDRDEAEFVAIAVLDLRAEIRAVLRGLRTIH